jgi:hypothetical protein
MASTSGSALSDPMVNAAAIAPKVCRVDVLCWFYIKCDEYRYVLGTAV